jgi:hypothetical protein
LDAVKDCLAINGPFKGFRTDQCGKRGHNVEPT